MNQSKTNVLFILVDDLRPQLACYGQAQMFTPHIDALAGDGGMLFERNFCQQAVCAPSRCNILTGCRPDTTRVYDLDTPLRRAMPGALTMPEHFKNHGYRTVSIGKVYHHIDDDRQGWSAEPFSAKGSGGEQGRGYVTPEAIATMREHDVEAKRAGGALGKGPAFEIADVADDAYHDAANTDHAIAELARARGGPLFLAVGYTRPHLPFCAPRRYWDLYDVGQIGPADNGFPPAGAPGYALEDWGELRAYAGIPAEGPMPPALARSLVHGYHACVSYLDAQVGRLLAALDRLGLRESTVVVLCADHGFKLGEHGAWTKHGLFDVDTRVPLIFRAQGTGGGEKRTGALTENVDIFPTLCDLCDLPLPAHLEGVSLTPLFENPRRPWKTAAFSQYPRGGEIMGYSMRTDRHRYTEWRDRATGLVRDRELYDHRSDPQENANLAASASSASIVEDLSRTLRRGWAAARPHGGSGDGRRS